jgi:hypothetical protein
MLSGLLSLLGIVPAVLGTVDGITKAIANERLKLIDAKTEQERIETQERISALQSRQAVLIAEAATPAGIWNARFRGLLALPAIIVLWKLIVWDKVIGSMVGCSGDTAPGTCGAFTTDKLDDHMWYLVYAAIGFYLLAQALGGKK